MSNPNIVGFSDRRRASNGRSPQSSTVDPAQDVFMQSGPLTDPREQGFFEMLRTTVSPGLKCCSFAVIMIIMLLIAFSVQVAADGLSRAQLAKDFLPIELEGPFSRHLVLTYDSIRLKFEFWRFLSALFVHRNALHLLSSLMSLLIWGSLFERLVTPLKLQLYYFIGGVVGLSFANVVLGRGAPLLGAGPAVFAIFGGSLGYLLLNWKNMEGLPSRFSWMLMIIFIVVFSLLFSSGAESLATHMGGFLSGMFVGLALSDRYQPPNTTDLGPNSHESTLFVLGIVFLGILLIVPLTAVFLTK